MPDNPKILLLDDEQDMLELYQQLLRTLSCKPEVQICDSGSRALAMLEAEPFTLMISDLHMPKMDGLQVLSIVRRKYPDMKVMVMTAVIDEQFRARAYALGVDLFWQKPSSEQEVKLFMEGVESVLQRHEQGGFRGVQSKSLVDIIQLECLSQSSTVLKITNGPLEGRIWIVNGEVVDATVGDMAGEAAFKKVLSWRAGNFENLPADPARARTIFNSYQGLLLDSAQSMDEAQAIKSPSVSLSELPEGAAARPTPLQESAKVRGVDFLLVVPKDQAKPIENWGVDNVEPLAKWVRRTLADFHDLGEHFIVGTLREIEGRGIKRNVTLVETGELQICVGLQRNLSADECRETLKNVLAKWVS